MTDPSSPRSLLPFRWIHRMPVVLADALDEEKSARLPAVRRDLVGTVGRNGVALSGLQQDVFGRAEHFDLDGALEADGRVGDGGVVVPGNRLSRRERALLHAHVRAFRDPVDFAGAHVRFGHGFTLSNLFA